MVCLVVPESVAGCHGRGLMRFVSLVSCFYWCVCLFRISTSTFAGSCGAPSSFRTSILSLLPHFLPKRKCPGWICPESLPLRRLILRFHVRLTFSPVVRPPTSTAFVCGIRTLSSAATFIASRVCGMRLWTAFPATTSFAHGSIMAFISRPSFNASRALSGPVGFLIPTLRPGCTFRMRRSARTMWTLFPRPFVFVFRKAV